MLLEIIKETLNSLYSENNIIVLKGFPNSIMSDLNKTESFIDISPLNESLEIDLKKIKLNWTSSISNMTKNTGRLLFFESFIFLSRNINLDILEKEFVILENNFLDIYPNQSNEKPEDYDLAIDKQKDILDEGLFLDFYSESYKIENKFYLRYIDGLFEDFENVKVSTFLDGKVELEFKIVTEKDLPNNGIYFNKKDQQFINFKEKLLYKNSVEYVNLIVTDSIVNNKDNNKDLKIFVDFLNQLKINFTIYKIITEIKISTRDEFKDILLDHWGSTEFRQLEIYSDPDISNKTIEISQGMVVEEIVRQYENALSGKNFSDLFLTAPTGAGKSLLFQLPAIYLAKNYKAVTIVISPLIALMKDQVFALKDKRNYNEVEYINSELSLLERERIIKDVINEEVSVLYMSPELLLSHDIKTFIGERPLGLLVIDEAHLVTTWGRDFRVDYWYIGNFVRKIRKYNDYHFITLAVTATAIYQGDHDMVFETINSLNMKTPLLYIGQTKRKNIEFEIKPIKLKGAHEESKLIETMNRIEGFIRKGHKSLVYCPWTTQIDNIRNRLDPKYLGLVGKYFGRLDKTEKSDFQQRFMSGDIKSIIATKAFGMGIDIDDITVVYHHAPSGHLTDYVQEIGRLARKEELTGLAIVDFDRRDLKFSKILYGLSSLKQYQIVLVLKKILNIYKINKNRNMLVSVNDFEYIFSFNKTDVEQKVKSSLLLLENDLLNKYKFNVIIARPKSLFTTVFIRVKNENFQYFENKFKEYIKIIGEDKKKGGHLYVLSLDKLWEDEFQDQSFPMIKKEFFNKELFKKWDLTVTPQLKFTITLNGKSEEMFRKLTEYFENIEKSFSSFKGFFSKNEFIKELNKYFKNRTLSMRVADLFLSIYSSRMDVTTRHQLANNTFIQSKRVDHTWNYRVINRAYPSVKASIRRKFNNIFYHGEKDIHKEFIPATKFGMERNENLFRLAYVIETFDLGTYEVTGGEIPAIFLRINDPLKLERLVKKGYTNDILSGIESRQKKSVEIMEYFFTNNLSNEERWNFIEDYFLGKDVVGEQDNY